eukprot:symbB.v1.2.032709.t3/scaffold3962.1/size79057/3
MVDLLNLDSAPGRQQADDCWSVVSEARRNGQEPSVSLVGSQVQCTDTKKQPGSHSLAAWSRREDWDKAIAAYQEAYSVAQVSSDEKTTGRLAFELAQASRPSLINSFPLPQELKWRSSGRGVFENSVLYFKGDLTGAKGYAEEAVKLLIPLDLGVGLCCNTDSHLLQSLTLCKRLEGRSGAPGDLSGTSFEALMLLSRVYEDLCLRFLELH